MTAAATTGAGPLAGPASGPTVVTSPGIYDLPEAAYHADPVPGGSLSSTGARKLLPPSCPTLFRHEQQHPAPPRPEFEFGSAVHRLVLGAGPELEVVDADSWRTKTAQAAAAEARDADQIPILASDYERACAMAVAVAEHPVAGPLFTSSTGQPEQSLFWQDDATGVWCRARLDWLRSPLVVDYKTTRDASPEAVSRSVADYGYQVQAAWYLAGARALELVPADGDFVFVFQQKTPPYLITVTRLDPADLEIGAAMCRRALHIYADCRAADTWPAWTSGVTTTCLPPWAATRLAEEYL